MTPDINLGRIFLAASRMNAGEARKVIEIAIKALESPDEPTEGEKHFSKRAKHIERMESSVRRVMDYAKHETLRKIEKHFRAHPPGAITSADSGDQKPSSLAERLTFSRPDFTEELLAALREDSAATLAAAGQGLFDEVGKDDPFKLPDKQAVKFLDTRANLLSNVPDEVHSTIMNAIQDGLENGDTRKELMSKIASKWDEIGKSRSETIANTETAAAFNYARDKAMKQAGVTHKKWLHSQSPLIKEPRPTHIENDRQTVPIGEPFDIGGVKFMYPSDSSLGAGPEDIINCHCVALPAEEPIKSAGEKEGHPFRGNQYTDQTFYHGSPQTFSQFDPSMSESAKGSSGGMIWLTTHKGEAEAISQFAPTTGKRNSSVAAFKPNIKNPLVLDFKGERLTPNDRYRAIEKAKANGHDAILFKNLDIIGGKADYLAVFNASSLTKK